jgi:hypothetical protein
MDYLSSLYTRAKEAITGTVQTPVTDTVKNTGLAPVATDSGAQKMLGTAPESSGTTMTGGKKPRKTRRARKSKKTRRH